MEQAIKPIETRYNGCRFRSRLEARWAVFFDAMGIEYQYELEGFKMPDGISYLPDFYLPKNERWFEIKGKRLSNEEIEKCEKFCEAQDSEGIKFSIAIGEPSIGLLPHEKNYSLSNPFGGIWVYSYNWRSGTFKPGDDPELNASAEVIHDPNTLYGCPDLTEEPIMTRFMPFLWYIDSKPYAMMHAIAGKIAREARFEHGETPSAQSVREAARREYKDFLKSIGEASA